MNARSTVKEAKLLASAASDAAGESGLVVNVNVGFNISVGKLNPDQAKTFIRKYKDSLSSFLDDMQGEFAINIVPDYSDNKELQALAKEQQEKTASIIKMAQEKYNTLKGSLVPLTEAVEPSSQEGGDGSSSAA